MSAPGGRASLAVSSIVVAGGRLSSLSFHRVTLSLLMLGVPRGGTLFRKLFLDLRRLLAGTWPERGCLWSVD